MTASLHTSQPGFWCKQCPPRLACQASQSVQAQLLLKLNVGSSSCSCPKAQLQQQLCLRAATVHLHATLPCACQTMLPHLLVEPGLHVGTD